MIPSFRREIQIPMKHCAADLNPVSSVDNDLNDPEAKHTIPWPNSRQESIHRSMVPHTSIF